MGASSLFRILYYVVKISLYMLVLIVLFNGFLSEIIYVVKRQYRIYVSRVDTKKHSSLYNHIDKIYFTLKGVSDSGSVYKFYTISIAFFVVTLMIMISLSDVLFAILISSLITLLPYIFLRMRLYRIRVESSYDADKVVTEIANQYKISDFNMREAVRKSEKYLASAPFCRKHIYALALSLDTYKTEEELKKYLDYFVFSINTQWAKMLANNIYFAVVKNFNVAEGLSDILKDIKNSYEISESSKRENTESVVMIFYMAPILFFISPFLAKWMMDFPIRKFLQYQFKTPIGIALFSVIIVGYIFSTFLIYFINRKKFDI